jgi:hypothetical protein
MNSKRAGTWEELFHFLRAVWDDSADYFDLGGGIGKT